jgi:hypothetical protein
MNPTIGGHEVPIGLALITVALFAAATINLFTKEAATISGVLFTLLFYATFVASERAAARHAAAHGEHTDQFQLMREADVGLSQLAARPGNVLVPVRDYNTLAHLDQVVRDTDTEARDIVVVTVRLLQGPDAGIENIDRAELFTDYEQRLFTRVVAVAERHGRTVKLLVVPAANVFDALVQTAVQLRSSEVVVGESAKLTAADQAHYLGAAWDRSAKHAPVATRLVVIAADGRSQTFSLGAHAPQLADADVERIHTLWLDAVDRLGPGVHHRDIVSAALSSYEEEFRRDDARAVARLRQSA